MIRDLQLAKAPTWGPVFEVVAGITFAGVFIASPERNLLSWVTIGAAIVSIASAMRTTRMEVRLVGSTLRVVNFWRTTDISLDDIISVIPGGPVAGRLSLVVADADKPIEIQVSPRSGKRREELRRQLQQVLAAR